VGYTTEFEGSFSIEPAMQQEHVAFINAYAERNHRGDEPKTPSYYCQWVVNNGKLQWDMNEKFYNYVEWLEYLIEHFLSPWNYKLKGTIKYSGEETTDFGTITVKNNTVIKLETINGLSSNIEKAKKILSKVTWETIYRFDSHGLMNIIDAALVELNK